MLELASCGAQVLHNRSVEMAKKYNVNLEVLSSFSRKPGTIVKGGNIVEKMLVSSVAKDTDVARVSVVGVNNEPGIAFKLFSLLAKEGVNVDIILQSIGRDNKKDISFTTHIDSLDTALKVLDDNHELLGDCTIDSNTNIAKISIVGAGMLHNSGVAAKMFEALYDANININMISTSEIKISVLIDKDKADLAVSTIHSKFINK
jgi:aspartate kinase